MKSFNDFLEESGDAASRASSFRGQAQGGSGTMGVNTSSNYQYKTRKIELPAGKKKEEPKKAPEKKPSQKALPAGKERKALPPSPQKKSIAGGSSSIVKRTSSSLARSA